MTTIEAKDNGLLKALVEDAKIEVREGGQYPWYVSSDPLRDVARLPVGLVRVTAPSEKRSLVPFDQIARHKELFIKFHGQVARVPVTDRKGEKLTVDGVPYTIEQLASMGAMWAVEEIGPCNLFVQI